METDNNLIAHALSEFIASNDEAEELPLNDAATVDSLHEPPFMATETLLSPENEAWVDSVLVDPELPQDVRTAMADALLNTLRAANATSGVNVMQKESKTVETSQVEVDSDTRVDIFRVWDLGNTSVEGEEELVIIKQLTEFFEETRIGDLPVERGDQEIEDESCVAQEIEEELIDVMAHLSLDPFSD